MAIPPSPEFLQLQPVVAGRYSLEREIGRGGMGVVFLARDVALDRPVAIKLLPSAFATQPDRRERFLREARTAAKLSHPNIVPIHLVEEQGDVVFFVMMFVDGETLGQRVRRGGPLTASQATRMMQEVAWALAYAHGRGVVHRDIKPDNILLDKDSGRAMVTDFGIARVVDTGTLSSLGEVVGTMHYMSPEQASGEPVDGRSDLFSLGVATFFALTGTLPFEGSSLPAVALKIVSAEPPRLASLRSDVPPALAEAVHRCLEKRADARFASGEELADAVGTSVVATEAAPQIRILMRISRDLDQSIAMIPFAVIIVPAVWKALWPAEWWAVLMLMLMLATPIALAPIQMFVLARNALKAGLGPADVKRANERALLAAQEELAVGFPRVYSEEDLRSRSRKWMWMGHVGLVGCLGSLLFAIASRPVGSDSPLILIVVLGFIASVLGYGAGLSLRVHAFNKKKLRERARIGLTMGQRLLSTRFVDWLFRMAGTGLDVRPQAEPPASERTEVLIASAVDNAFRQLPSPLQSRFAAVPRVVRKLEADAMLLRNQEDELRRAAAQAQRPDEIERACLKVRERLATAVAALESIRLDVLRLAAGVGSPDDLTMNLERARSVGSAVDAELFGLREVKKLLTTPT